jgi:hypothetical protein
LIHSSAAISLGQAIARLFNKHPATLNLRAIESQSVRLSANFS